LSQPGGLNRGRLPDLFAQALELDPGARRTLLAEVAAEDAGMARRLERMLAAEGGPSPLDDPAWSAATEWPAPEPDRMADDAPTRIGPYRILRELGRGGMGRVFLAEEEAEDFHRTVALKVVQDPALGEEAIRRFRDEVRILASLEHPGIARFYDGGRAEDGTWFLALEYVDGEDLLAFVRRRGFAVRSRVELFLQVLDAVDFAHRQLVVHRDLKPGNVLVSGDGRAKLLDFGISKILDPELHPERDDRTRTELRALTPAYASPEQLRGNRVTTASDVYSLGVMLYELLAGRRPFARREPGSGALAELSGVVLERAPSPPSTAARETTAADAEETTGMRWRDLAGDLDAITLKALRAEPEGRYRSAAALAEDLRRWLRGEPVEARRGGRRYRLGKFVARHRPAVAFAAVAFLALAAGVVGTVVQWRAAMRQAAIAEERRDFALRQLSRAEAINELNSFLLTDAAPVSKAFTVGDLLGRAERVIRRDRGWSVENRVAVLLAIGRQFERIDENTRARPLVEEAYALSRRSRDAATRAAAACAMADTEATAGKFQRAEALFAGGMAELGEEPHLALQRVFCLLRGAEVARNAEDPTRAVARAEAADTLLRASGQGSALLALRVAMDLAESYRKAEEPLRADTTFAEADRRLTALGFAETETAGTLLNNWALTVGSLGRPLEAERLFRRSVEISSAVGGDTPVSPVLLNNLGRTLLDLGRVAEAADYVERAEAEARRTGNRVALRFALIGRILVDLERGELDGAERSLAELGSDWKAAFPPEHFLHGIHASMRGMLAAARGDLAAASAEHDRAVAIVDATPQRAGALPIVLLRRSDVALRRAEVARALADAALAVQLEEAGGRPGSPSYRVGLARLALGRALAAQGKREEARQAFAGASANLEPTLGHDHRDTRAARELAARLESPGKG